MIKMQEDYNQSNQSCQSQSYECLTAKVYEQLQHSNELAFEFIRELGEFRSSNLPENLSAYVKERKMPSKSADQIQKLLEARLNKMIKNNKVKKNWSQDDIYILIWLLGKYMHKNNILSHQLMVRKDWLEISSMIAGSSAHSCMFKFISLKKFKLAFHKWQKQEESLLAEIISQQIGDYNWKKIAVKLYENGGKRKIYRTPKQCREHWSCYLDPKIKKGPWDKDQDQKLVNTVFSNQGIKKWSLIKKDFLGRTENALKNRYNLLIQKKRKVFPDKSLTEEQIMIKIIQTFNQENQQLQNKNKINTKLDVSQAQKNEILQNRSQQIQQIVQKQQQKFQNSIKNVDSNGDSFGSKKQEWNQNNFISNPTTNLVPLIPEENRSDILKYPGVNYIIFNFVPIAQGFDQANLQVMNNWYYKIENQ